MYFIKKICYSIFTLIFISILVFSLFEIMPQNPILSRISVDTANNAEMIDALSEKYNLDEPAYKRYFQWVGSTLDSDNQYSIIYPSSTVKELLLDTLPTTLALTFSSLIVSLIIAIPITIYIALNRKSFLSKVLLNSSILFISIPSFLLSLILLYLFCIKIKLFSLTGGSLFLPIAVLSLPSISLISRYLLPRMKTEVKEDYITLLKSKGLTNGEIIRKHVLKNSLIPVISIINIIFTGILTGTVIVENIFVLNGTGRLMVNAINGGDYILIEALVLCYCFLILLVALLTDFLYFKVDKRIKLK